MVSLASWLSLLYAVSLIASGGATQVVAKSETFSIGIKQETEVTVLFYLLIDVNSNDL